MKAYESVSFVPKVPYGGNTDLTALRQRLLFTYSR